MLKYDNNTVGKVNEGATPILKAYKGGVMCFNNGLEGGTSTPSQVPCFWVTSDITHYEGNFEDVYDQTTEKWYKLNNLGEYEEYGIYGDTRNTTTYIGKLVIENGYEYEWNGSEWDNLGEITISRLPSGYTELDYIENTSMAYINTGFKPNQDTRIVLNMQSMTSTKAGILCGAGGWDKIGGMWLDYENNTAGALHISWGTKTTWSVFNNITGDYNEHTYDWNKNSFYRDDVLVETITYGSFQCTDDLALFTAIQNGGALSSQDNYVKGRLRESDIYDNGTKVRNYVPCKSPENVVGVYDTVNGTFQGSANNSYSFVSGTAITPQVIYPKNYSAMTAPEDNVSFTSFTEARSYECPWVLQKATIKKPTNHYYFNYQYEWVKGAEPTEPLTKWVETGDEICYQGYMYDNSEEEYESYDNATWLPTGNLRPIGEAGESCGLPNVPFILNYNAKEYDASTHTIPKTQGQLQNVDAVVDFGTSNVIDHSVDGYISSTGTSRNGGCRFSISGNNGTYLNRNNTSTGCTLTIVSKAKNNGGSSSHTIMANRVGGGTSTLNWMWRYESTRLYFSPNNAQATDVLACDTSETPIIASVNVYYDGGVKKQYKDWTNNTQSVVFSHSYLNAQPTNGGTLLCDYATNNDEFFIGDFYWVYMTFENLTDEQIQQVIAYNEGL